MKSIDSHKSALVLSAASKSSHRVGTRGNALDVNQGGHPVNARRRNAAQQGPAAAAAAVGESALFLDLGTLPSDGTVGHLTYDHETDQGEVQVELQGALDADDLDVLAAHAQAVAACLRATRTEHRQERLRREAGFAPVRAARG
jgi:hypothetical protein